MNNQPTGLNPGYSAPTQGGSFLDKIAKFAPTIGGVVGGIGGELLDPFGGGVVGAGLGSGLGKGIENASQGKSPLAMSDLGAAAEGAAGQGAGDVLGGVLGAIGGKAANFGANQIEKSSLQDAFGGMSQADRINLNLDNSVNLAKQAGIPTSGDPSMIADAWDAARGIATGVTNGEKGFLNGTTDNIVNDTMAKTGQRVDYSGFGDQANQALQKFNVDGSTPTTAGKGGLPKMTGAAANLNSSINNAFINSPDALSVPRALREVASANSHIPGATKAVNSLIDFANSKIYTPEVQDAIKAYQVPDAIAQNLLQISQGITGNTDYGNFLINTMNNANKGSDITDVERQLIDMGEAGKKASQLIPDAARFNNTPSAADEAIGHVTSGNKAGAIGSVIRKGASPKVTGGIANKMGGLLERISPFTSNKGVADEVQPMLHTGVLNKIPGALGAGALTSPNAIQPAPVGGQLPGQGGSNMQPNIQQNPLMQTYQELAQHPFMPGVASALQQLAPKAMQLQSASSLLPQVEQAYGAAGGGQGPILGGLAKIGGMLGVGPAATYSKQAAQLQQILAQLGLGQGYIPQVTQAPQSGQLGFQQLQSILSGVPSQ